MRVYCTIIHILIIVAIICFLVSIIKECVKANQQVEKPGFLKRILKYFWVPYKTCWEWKAKYPFLL